jgi:hypothetical protein
LPELFLFLDVFFKGLYFLADPLFWRHMPVLEVEEFKFFDLHQLEGLLRSGLA